MPENTKKGIRDSYDVIVIGGGPAGLAAALSARREGAERVLLLERQDWLGGILNQCIHNGFGLHWFKEELTGPEYAERFIDELAQSDVEVLCGAMVLDLFPDRSLSVIHRERGYMQLNARAVVLAMGCRERTRGAIGIPGTRPAGILTAGAAQLYMNIEGWQIGKRAVILGSGDIGLIMARRLTLEGAKVLGVFELMPYSGGLTRNIVQCLDDYDIPLHLSHTVTDIRGDKRLEGVTVQRMDENLRPVPGTQWDIECDTLLLSVGLIPENELSRRCGVQIDTRTGGPVVMENMETSVPGVFACGNVAHVHDLVDFVTAEAVRAGASAAAFGLTGKEAPDTVIALENGEGVGYAVPQKIRASRVDKAVDVFFRVRKIYAASHVELRSDGEVIARYAREYMTPGEMEKVTLPKVLLERIRDGRGILSVAEDNNTEKGGQS